VQARVSFLIAVTLAAAACNKPADGPTPGAASGSTTAQPPPPAPPPPPPAPPKAKTCADGDAAACVTEAKAIAPQGAYRATMSKEQADAKEQATTKLASRACELGNGEGCALVARYGKFDDSDKNLEHACQLGHVASCGSVGRGLAERGGKADRARAAELLEKACDADAMDWMALTAHHGGFCRQLEQLYRDKLKDKARAKNAHERACAQGDKLGCTCKTDDDCGKVPDDQSGSYACTGGACAIEGG
jgi:hypothetical protein